VPIELSVAWVAAGVVACLVRERFTRAWPFGLKQVRREYLAEQP